MDVRQLRYFVQVIELKSFSRAAEVLHVAQPALGMQIRKLEDELQTQLLSRHSRGVRPTAAGLLLQEHALGILKQVDETKRLVRDTSGPAKGTVTLGVTPSTPPAKVIELIQRSAVELPNVQIIIREGVNTTVFDWIRAGRADLGLVYLAEDAPGDLTITELMEEDAVFVQSRGGDGTGPATIPLADICQHPLILPSRPHHLRNLLQIVADRAGLDLDVAYEMESVGTTLAMVERDLAATVLPRGAVTHHAGERRLLVQAIVEPRLPLTVALMCLSARVVSRAEVLLRQILTEVATAADG